MIVLVDMDDVMADTSEYLYETLMVRYPNVLEFKVPRKKFDIKDEYSFGNLLKVESVLYSLDFQSSIPPVKGSLDAVREIHKRGHDVVFCSTPHKYYETSVLQKYQWLENHLGKPFDRKLILTEDKTLIRGDLLIDDKPEINGLRFPSWEHILFATSYNFHVDSRRRLYHWLDWKNVLSEL
ncbi:5'-3'-deoxyribonucleotidase [archaeon]|jgi:5'-nucleotidase|nr:5'-3'-deoxyribonucleotidase [archaeon]